MKKNLKGGLGNDMGSLLERKEKQAKKQTTTSKTSTSNNFDSEMVETLYNNARNQPRISFWDLESKIILNYLKETEPKFSISHKISTILQEHFQKEYPELWSEIKGLKNK